jgi:hypothetical protein
MSPGGPILTSVDTGSGILVDVRLVEVEQQVPVARGAGEQRLQRVQKGLAPGRVGPAEQL